MEEISQVETVDDDVEVGQQNEDDDDEAPDEILTKFGEGLRKTADISSKIEAIEETLRRSQALENFINSKPPNNPQRLRLAMNSLIYKRIANSLTTVTWNRTWRKAAVEELCKTKFLDFFYQALVDCDYIEEPTYAANLYKVVVVFTDYSLSASLMLAQKGIVSILIQMIEDDRLRTKKPTSRLLIQAISSVHNISKVPECRTLFQQNNAVEALKYFLSSDGNGSKIQMSTLCALSFILSDNDANLLSDQYNIIPKLVQTTEKALKMKGRKAYLGFSAEELTDALSNLAINDENKSKLVRNGMLPLLAKMLKMNPAFLRERSISCLWRLAFSEEVRSKILAEPDLMTSLQGIADDESTEEDDLKSKAKNAAEFIRLGSSLGSNDSGIELEKATSMKLRKRQHVFISYSWKQQEVVVKIRDSLLEKGFEVWFDLDKMHGSTLEAMASAVENASLVLICYSEDYRQSNMCRTEAEYVFRLQKPFVPVNFQYRYQPDGWLGIIIGARLYIDFSLKERLLETALSLLFAEIGQFKLETTKKEGKPIPAITAVRAPVKPETSSCHKCDILETKIDRINKNIEKLMSDLCETTTFKSSKCGDIEKWSASDIEDWLSREALPKDLLPGFNGRYLIALLNMKLQAPKTYFQSILGFFEDSLELSVRFTSALEQLF